MPRKVFKCDPNSIYHVSARSRNQDWYDLPMDLVWRIFSVELRFIAHAYNLEILSFVLMANHFHLLVKAPKGNLSAAMQRLLWRTSTEMQDFSGRTNQIWGRRFYRCRLDNYHHLMNSYKYIYQNPIRANICEKVEEYPYSTLFSILGRQHHFIPTALENLIFDNGVEESLNWLNQCASDEANEHMRLALRRNEFKLPCRGGRQSPYQAQYI